MTTKSLSEKQVIILINSDNIKKFIEESSSHIFNLNRALKISSQKSWSTLFN